MSGMRLWIRSRPAGLPMRRFVTIAVAAVLVATCGPAPCPCQLVALLRPVPKQDSRLPLSPRPACQCCHAPHSDASDETISGGATGVTNAARLPDPPKQPCEHGPKLELGSIGVLGELQLEVETDHVAAVLSHPFSGSHADFTISGQQFQHCLLPLSHFRALRFAHAFRS